MAIKKQEFYEGAALHSLARTGRLSSVKYNAPFFQLNDHFYILLKYSTRGRSPWGFTFTPEEQLLLRDTASKEKTVIGLVCGSDGIAAIRYDSYLSIAAPRSSALHISCYRQHGQHYEINGPDGVLEHKVSPSRWRQVLDLWEPDR